MISAEINIVGETVEEISEVLLVLSRMVANSCQLDEPEGVHKVDPTEQINPKMKGFVTFTVLPEYQEGDLEKFFGCMPDAKHDDDPPAQSGAGEAKEA